MKKVYCIIFDYEGYEERIEGIYATLTDVINQLYADAKEWGYDTIADYLADGETAIVEWELGTNEKHEIELSNIL